MNLGPLSNTYVSPHFGSPFGPTDMQSSLLNEPENVLGTLTLKDPKEAAKKGITEREDGIYLGNTLVLPKVMVVKNG